MTEEECLAIADAVTRFMRDAASRLAAIAEAGGWSVEALVEFLSSWVSYNRAAAMAGGYRID